MMHALRAVIRDRAGQGVAEYGMMLLIVAAGAIGVLQVLGGGLTQLYNGIVSLVP